MYNSSAHSGAVVWLTLNFIEKGVMPMSVYEAISLMISFGALIALLTIDKEK